MIKIEILKTEISSYDLVDGAVYNLYLTDIYNRQWRYSGTAESKSEFRVLSEVQTLEKKVKEEGFFDPSLYWVYSDNEYLDGKVFDSIEKVNEVFSYSDLGDQADFWEAYVTTEGGLYYRHPKIFYDYKKYMQFVNAIKDKGTVNLKYWVCMGSYDYDCNYNQEFEEQYEEVYDEDYWQDKADREVLAMIEADTLPDGTVPGFR